MWDVQTGAEIARFKGHTSWVHTLAFSPSGNLFASGSIDETVRIWDSRTGELKQVFRGHQDWITHVVFSPDEQVLASASHDETVRLWNVSSGESIMPILKHGFIVWKVIFTSDGNQLISATEKGLHIWDRYTGELQQHLSSHVFSAHGLGISPLEDRLFLIGHGGIWIWRKTSSGFVVDDRLCIKISYSGDSSRAVFSPDGKSLLVFIRTDDIDAPSGLFIYDLCSRAKIPILDHQKFIHWFVVSPDGSSVAFSYRDDHCREIRMLDIPLLLPITLAALSPDGDIVACAFSDGSVWLGSPKGLPVVNKQLANEGEVGKLNRFVFSSDNALLAAVDDEFVYLWDLSTHNLRWRAASKDLARITSLSFLADRCTLVSSHDDQNIYTWDSEGGKVSSSRLLEASASSQIELDLSLLLDVDQSHTHEVAGTRWFPAKEEGTGFWAYVDSCLIRVRSDGSVTGLPLNS